MSDNNNLKNAIERISQSIYHENILTSFIENLDEVLGERFEEANKITNEVGYKIIETIENTTNIAHSIEDMSKNSRIEKDEVSELNKNIINKLHNVGGNLNQVKTDVSESINLVSKALESFDEVKEITKNINKIAKKTNMLSINASIEAAKAKEHGRGFAVVAEEIQKLSTETNESAKQINDKIKNLSDEIKTVLEKINYISELFELVAGVTEDSLGILEKNEKFLDELVSLLESNTLILEENIGNLSMSKDDIMNLINTISMLNAVIRNVLKMQKDIKDIKI
jgi:methyl-accepting chemotaxis protein